MNFDDNPQEAEYRATVRAWIEANAPDMSVLAPEELRVQRAVASGFEEDDVRRRIAQQITDAERAAATEARIRALHAVKRVAA